jgi:hypothetical protein
MNANLILSAAVLIIAVNMVGTASCQEANTVQLGEYTLQVGTVPYHGTVAGYSYSGTLDGAMWTITLQKRTEDMLNYAYNYLYSGVYTEKNNIGYDYITIDGKSGAWAQGFADLPMLNPVTHRYDDVNPVSLRAAIFHVNDQMDCCIYVQNGVRLFEDIVKTIHVN